MTNNDGRNDSNLVREWAKVYFDEESKKEESIHRQASSLLIATTLLAGAFFALLFIVFRLSSVQKSYFIRHYIMFATLVILCGFVASLLLNMFAQSRRKKDSYIDFIDVYQGLNEDKDGDFNYVLADNLAKLQKAKRISNNRKTSLLNGSIVFLFLSILGTLVFFLIGLILIELQIENKYALILICGLFIIILLIIGCIAKFIYDKAKAK